MFASRRFWWAAFLNILLATVIHCVKITKITIPEYYVIEDSEKPDTLVLDCEYELQRSEENGLVIKWTFEGEIIYQWIPHHKPHVLRAHMRDKVDATYEASTKPFHQYRALALINPTWNSTGTYSCLADTFESTDRKSGFMQIIDKSKSSVEICRNVVNEVEEISCIASHVYPQPVLNLTLNDEPIPKKADKVHLRADGLFDVTTVGATPLLDAETTGEITCHVYFPRTNFTMEKILSLSGSDEVYKTSKLLMIFTIMFCLIFNDFRSKFV